MKCVEQEALQVETWMRRRLAIKLPVDWPTNWKKRGSGKPGKCPGARVEGCGLKG